MRQDCAEAKPLPGERIVARFETGIADAAGDAIRLAFCAAFAALFLAFGIINVAANIFSGCILIITGAVLSAFFVFNFIVFVLEIRNVRGSEIVLTDRRVTGIKRYARKIIIDIPLENIASVELVMPYFTGGFGLSGNRTLVIKVLDEAEKNGFKIYKFRSVQKAGEIAGMIKAGTEKAYASDLPLQLVESEEPSADSLTELPEVSSEEPSFEPPELGFD